jgi:phenylacetate-CoA ligase
MIYHREYEALSREELEQLQIERLQSTLNRVYRNVALYRQKFDDYKINIEAIKEINDIRKLPFTTKDDLRKSYPYDMFAVPLRDVVRIHSSIGRTGRPIAIGYTRNDLQNWSILVARLLAAAGVTEHDFVQMAFDYSMVTGGFGFHYGAERLGASVIPSSSNSSIRRQIIIMKDYKSSVLLSTPGYGIKIAHILKEMGIHPEQLNLRVGLFGAEPWNEEIRTQIEQELHIDAYNNYGVNELVGPGTAGECEMKNGLHVNEDNFIVEIIDPETLDPVGPGEEGELVFTTITKEAFPLIRYRTSDISSLIAGECPCGRTFSRIKTVAARTDDMIVIMGVNVFPAQIEEILKRAEGVEPHYEVFVNNRDGVDFLEVRVEVSEKVFNDEIKILESLKERISRLLEEEIGVPAKIILVEPRTLSEKG